MKVTYSEDGKNAYFDGYKFRKDAKTGYFLATKPTHNGRRERLHCYMWRYYKGDVPEGYHIHHKDGDKNHNEIDNLICINGKAHTSLHAKAYADKNKDKLLKNLQEKAIPKASEWHKSEEGRAWHKEHCPNVWDKVEPKEHVCQYCGKTYYSKVGKGSKFCSNNCKAAARRLSGIDDETRECVICGKEFRCNKYSYRKCCSDECHHELLRNCKNREMRNVSGL